MDAMDGHALGAIESMEALGVMDVMGAVGSMGALSGLDAMKAMGAPLYVGRHKPYGHSAHSWKRLVRSRRPVHPRSKAKRRTKRQPISTAHDTGPALKSVIAIMEIIGLFVRPFTLAAP